MGKSFEYVGDRHARLVLARWGLGRFTRERSVYTWHTLYFIGRESSDGLVNAVKIGVCGNNAARSVETRLRSLQTSCPDRLVIIGGIPNMTYIVEHAIHRRFAHLKIRGEWFWMDGDVLQFVDEILGPAPQPEAVEIA